MEIIDSHIHASFSSKFGHDFAKSIGVDYSLKGLKKELASNNIKAALVISGVFNTETPIELDFLSDLAKKANSLFPVCAVNPNKITNSGFEKLKKAIKNKQVYGIKIFLSYYPVYGTDKRYSRFYKLAAEYDCPIIFHTGDTRSDYMVKYAHPLQIDEIAVKFRNTKFIIAHLGNPWIRDASEVIYKNPNVFADLSALCIGSPAKHPSPDYVAKDIYYALDYVSDSSKFLYGSDWPLVKMKEYVKIIRNAVPKKHQRQIFFKNAKKLFNLPV